MIAVDAMGGDNAPTQIVKGVLSAARNAIPIMLVGQKQLLIRELAAIDPSWENYPITLVDAQDVIGMGEKAIEAVRSKRDSSLVKAVGCVASGAARAVVSAGNSGAFMAAATFVLGRQEGVDRPAIAAWLPARTGKVLALDLGATTDCKATNLVQFAHLGHDHIIKSLDISAPRVALLSVGEERNKGSLIVREAFELLERSTLNFVGNIEPGDLVKGKADVVVCDGFSGNVMLKTMEATASLLYASVTDQIAKRGEKSEQGDLVVSLARQLDTLGSSGALLLGVKGTVVVLHGRADADAVEKGILKAHSLVGGSQEREWNR